jgi:hypothetical protein
MGLGAKGEPGELCVGEPLVGAAAGGFSCCSAGASAAVGVGSGSADSVAVIGVGSFSFAIGASRVGSAVCSSLFTGACCCCEGSRQMSRALSTQPATPVVPTTRKRSAARYTPRVDPRLHSMREEQLPPAARTPRWTASSSVVGLIDRQHRLRKPCRHYRRGQPGTICRPIGKKKPSCITGTTPGQLPDGSFVAHVGYPTTEWQAR